MTRKLYQFVLAPALVALAATAVQAAPGDRTRARIQECQQRVDQADARIRDVVRDIANSGSPQATKELNMQLKAWEKERSTAQFDLYQAREQLRNLASVEAQLKADISAFIGACKQFAADMQRLREDGESHNRDADAQRQAVQEFNSRPANQRGQAEADRLNFWRDVVNSRRDRLQDRQKALETRRAQLLQWESTLKERARQFERY